MDVVNEKRTQALETYKKKSLKEEEKLQILLKKQYEKEWLDVDYQKITAEQIELQALLHEGWQGDTARGFQAYIEEVQELEQRAWKKELQAQADDLQEELGQVKGKLNQFEEQQARLRKELTS